MASIHSRNTKPEMIVRRYLWHAGFRYRINLKRLPGHPDVVLRKYRTCIFINGCFWHGHECDDFRRPHTNVSFWNNKILRNKQRDIEVQQRLAIMGWHCIVIWECELKSSIKEQTLKSLAYTLNHIYLKDHSFSYTKLEEETDNSFAADSNLCPTKNLEE